MNQNLTQESYQLAASSEKKLVQNETIDLLKYFFLFLHNWYYLLFGLVITIGLGYLYNRIVLPTYRVTTTLLIEENQQGLNMSAGNLMQGFGFRAGRQNMDNEMQRFQSWSLIDKSLKKLPFDIDYYVKGRVNEKSLYPNFPISVISDSLSSIPYSIEFSVYFTDSENIQIILDEKDQNNFNINAKYGEIIDRGKYKFQVVKDFKSWNTNYIGNTIYFKFNKTTSLVRDFQHRLEIKQPSNESTIIEISLLGTNPRKDVDFLSKLIDEFLATNLNKKNYEADRTIKFIDDQIKDISDSLIIAEDRLQEFRSQNRVMDISEQGSRVMEQAIRLEDERARLMIENDYYEYLNAYLSNDDQADQVIAPSTMGISDPMIISLVGQLAELQAEYYSLGAGGKNPLQVNLSVRIQNTRKALLETLKGIIRTNNYAINENQTRLRGLNRQAESLPVTERKLLGIEREFKLNDALYNFLLQKQAEAQIQKASNASDTEIIDPPRIQEIPTWPMAKLIYLIALILGVGIPAIILIVVDALSLKIESEEDISRLTFLPITGYIMRNKKKYQTIVINDPKSIVAESFRSLRTRLRFFTKEIKSPVILITSSMPGEGKTFTALNLASAYGLEKRKTILVGFDLRRPKLHENFSLDNSSGVSAFLIGDKILKEIIQVTENPFLDVLPSGPIPPNPTELIASKRTEQLITELKEIYEYIIIDSAPIGSVSDSYFLAALADTNLIVIRRRISIKRLVGKTLLDMQSTGIKNVGIVLNDIPPNKGYYGYKYTSN